MEIVDWCSDDEALTVERDWIASCENCGAELLNRIKSEQANTQRMTLDIPADWHKELKKRSLLAQANGEDISLAGLIREAIRDKYFPKDKAGKTQ